MIAAVAVIGAVIAIAVLTPKNTNLGPYGSDVNKPVAASVLQALTTIPESVYAAAGDSNLSPATLVSDTAWTSGGKPVVFYAGGEFCPYCAASRWVLVTALARFGTWSGLEYMLSSPSIEDPLTPTFTFVHATFSSPYIDVQAKELANLQGQAMQTLTSQQNAVYTKYNPSGTIPFIDIGNKYIWNGALASPPLFAGLNWSTIATQLHSGSGAIAHNVLPEANLVSAYICAVDGQQPASVCQAPEVTGALKSAASASTSSGSSSGGSSSLPG